MKSQRLIPIKVDHYGQVLNLTLKFYNKGIQNSLVMTHDTTNAGRRICIIANNFKMHWKESEKDRINTFASSTNYFKLRLHIGSVISGSV